jgi:hypothetical protein
MLNPISRKGTAIRMTFIGIASQPINPASQIITTAIPTNARMMSSRSR